MELIVSFLCLLVTLVGVKAAKEGPCFDFHGNSYLHFTPNNYDNNEAIHYTLKFRTNMPDGILMYARGLYGDDEALFIRNGKLEYHLFNTSPTGVEGYFGGHYEGDEMVNTGEWITVHVYRSWSSMDAAQRRERKQTGFMVDIGGQIHSHVDYSERTGISIQPTIYFGGYRESLSDTVSYFNGQIKDIREEKNEHVFENPSLNYMSRVGLACVDDFQPV